MVAVGVWCACGKGRGHRWEIGVGGFQFAMEETGMGGLAYFVNRVIDTGLVGVVGEWGRTVTVRDTQRDRWPRLLAVPHLRALLQD